MTKNKYIEPTPCPEQKDADKGILHFNVSGRFITKLARDMWAGDEEAHAIRTLTEGFNGMTEKIALQILTGRKILSGWNDKVKLLDDNEKMPSTIDIEQKKVNAYMRLVAEITEVRNSIEMQKVGVMAGAALTVEERQRFNDLRAKEIPDGTSLWGKDATFCEKLMVADDLNATLRADLRTLVTHANTILDLREENYNKVKNEQPGIVEDFDTATTLRYAMAGQELKMRIYEDKNLSDEEKRKRIEIQDEVQTRIMRGIKGQSELRLGKLAIKRDEKFEGDTGWLSPKGLFYSCEITQHVALADMLAEKEIGGEVELERLGWVKVTGGQWLKTCAQYKNKTKLTKAQLDAIFDWCNVHGWDLQWNGRKMTYKEFLEQEG